MFQFDDNFLQSAGLGDLPEDQKKAFLQDMNDELEFRVGTRLSEGMSDEQSSDFEKLIESADDQGVVKWLQTNRPNYKEVVAEELAKLKKEVFEGKDKILNSQNA